MDAIIPLAQLDALRADEQFWQARDATNLELAERGLYMTHLFTEADVFLQPDWLNRRLPIAGSLGEESLLMLFALALIISPLAYGGQEDRPAHQWLSVYQSGKTNWFPAVALIVHATNGVPDLIRELSCADAKHRELAGVVLSELYSDRYPQDPSTPTNSAGWSKWWEQSGKTNKVQTLWHNFDSHYK